MAPSDSSPSKRRRGGWIVLALLAFVAILATWLYREATAVPEFYAQALSTPPTATPPEVAADHLEREVLTLQNQVQRAEPWRLVLKEEDINAWLATELTEKMPHLLPQEVKDPRIVVREGTVYFACRHEKAFGGIFSIALEPSLTERANEVAIRVKSFALGRLPLPQKQYLDQVAQAAARSNIALQWEEEDGAAVALVQIPTEHEQLRDRHLQVESLDVREGEVIISGKAERQPSTPRTAQRG
jgi:hypothetical protein